MVQWVRMSSLRDECKSQVGRLYLSCIVGIRDLNCYHRTYLWACCKQCAGPEERGFHDTHRGLSPVHGVQG